MPIYEYQCSKCDKIFERIVSVADSTKTVFCDCSPKAKAKKIISAPSFRLEGSGWYETDFKTGNKKNLVQSDVKSKKTSKELKKTENSSSRLVAMPEAPADCADFEKHFLDDFCFLLYA